MLEGLFYRFDQTIRRLLSYVGGGGGSELRETSETAFSQ